MEKGHYLKIVKVCDGNGQAPTFGKEVNLAPILMVPSLIPIGVAWNQLFL